MFKFLLQSAWDELKPAVIIYGTIIAGAWALITANNQYHFFN